MKKIILFTMVTLFIFACGERQDKIFIPDPENSGTLVLNDTVDLSFGSCLYEPNDHFYICFDSVVGDSRCPTGVYCFWEGNAEVKFRYLKAAGEPVYFNLNTHLRFPNGITIDGYKYTLIDLAPYPSFNHPPQRGDYKARIVVTKVK